jgi:hypothetical protein
VHASHRFRFSERDFETSPIDRLAPPVAGSDETGRRPVRTRNDGGIDAAINGHRLMSPYLPPCAKREGRAQSTLRDLFEALGDELIYALASLGGLFGHAAMKLRGNAQ